MIKKIFFLFCYLFFICCFSQNQNKFGQDIIGLSSLVQLSVEPVSINLEDYFIDNQNIKIIKIPEGLKSLLRNNKLSLKGKMKNPIDVILIEKNGFQYSIPVRNTLQEPFKFSFKADKNYSDLKIKGNFNGWNINKNKLILKDDIYSFSTNLNPGRYEYVFVDGTKEFPDPTNPNKISNGIGGINSVFEVGDLNNEKLFIYTKSYKNNKIIIESKIKLNYLILIDNSILDTKYIIQKNNKTEINLPENLNNAGRCYLRIYGFDTKNVSNDILIPLENGKPILNSNELTRHDKQTMTMYSLMVDRFFDAKKDNNLPLNSPDVLFKNDYQGGDLAGITQKINTNFFKDLGVNTLWISPISQNPTKPYGLFDKAGIKSKFSGYHGYWPISSSKIDFRFGNDDEFNELINSAHNKKMNILLDYVANHVHQEHPLIKQHPNWITNNKTPDGRDNIALWDEFRLTTWFDPFLPSLDLENPEVTNIMTDSAVYWIKKFPLDGFRHDATKHIPNNFWRTLTKKIKQEIIIPENRSIYQIGETYGGHDLISSYVNNGMLDAQFEFSIYHHLTHSIIEPSVSMKNLATALEESLYYYGSHHLMGNISGNHDKARIISYSDESVKFNEDSKVAGYTRDIENQGNKGFDKLNQIMAFNLFIPGIPVIYYGDEIGMPGGNDPDCRRMMQFENLNENQINLRNSVKRMLELRNSRMSLLFGDTKILLSENDKLILMRTYFGETTILMLNKANNKIEFPKELIKQYLPEKYNIYNPKNNNSSEIENNSFIILYN